MFLGTSISSVDLAYFKEIKDKICETAIWKVSYHGNDQKKENKDKIASLGVDIDKIQMITLDEII